MSTHIHFGGGIFAFLLIGGFIILGIAIAIGASWNRVSRREHRDIEQATERLYDEQNEEDRMRTP